MGVDIFYIVFVVGLVVVIILIPRIFRRSK